MRILMTGRNGTVGTALARELAKRGHAVEGWNRQDAAPDSGARLAAYVDDVDPGFIIHAAVPSTGTGRPDEGKLVNIDWTAALARLAAARGIGFLYISSVMVFTDHAKGPFTPESVPDAAEGYGYEKRQGELATMMNHDDSHVARIGWQIGEKPGGNNMLSFFEEKSRSGGASVSRHFIPACSFLPDTAAAIADIMDLPSGLYQVDGNKRWSLFDIASALNALHGNPWVVKATDDFTFDQRMTDPRINVRPLSERLPALR